MIQIIHSVLTSAFSWFTGIIAPDAVPDSVFVMEPNIEGHDDLLFIHPRSPRDTDEFYKNALDMASSGLVGE